MSEKNLIDFAFRSGEANAAHAANSDEGETPNDAAIVAAIDGLDEIAQSALVAGEPAADAMGLVAFAYRQAAVPPNKLLTASLSDFAPMDSMLVRSIVASVRSSPEVVRALT